MSQQLRKLNDISIIACHNCYETRYSSSMYDALNNTSAIEIDIYPSKSVFKKSSNDKTWFVRHGLIQKNNNNCCGKNGNLDSCLEQIKKWHIENKDHELIFVFLDLKQGWNYGHMPEDLDKCILQNFSPNQILKPLDILNFDSSLKDVIAKNGWPQYADLKNKILFAITGGNLFNPNRTLSEYVTRQNKDGICFVCPLLKQKKEIESAKGFNRTTNNFIVMYNLSFKNRALGINIKESNFLSRVFGVTSDTQIVDELKRSVNFIAIDDFKRFQ